MSTAFRTGRPHGSHAPQSLLLRHGGCCTGLKAERISESEKPADHLAVMGTTPGDLNLQDNTGMNAEPSQSSEAGLAGGCLHISAWQYSQSTAEVSTLNWLLSYCPLLVQYITASSCYGRYCNFYSTPHTNLTKEFDKEFDVFYFYRDRSSRSRALSCMAHRLGLGRHLACCQRSEGGMH